MPTLPPVAIVTGGTRGIGRCIVERLYADGFHILFAHSNSPDEAQQLETQFNDPQRIKGFQIDITDPMAGTTLFNAAANLGDVVALINNAGVTGRLGPITLLTDNDLERVINVNLTAVVRLCREAAIRWTNTASPYKRSIVNITSVAARTGSPGEYVSYAATKAAVETLSIGLGKELAASGIFVNAVSPGTIDTTIHERAGEPGRAQRVAERIPMKRPGQPEEIANAVSWLLSDQSSYVTGTVLPIAGGL